MRKIKLATQINIIFTVVTLFSGVVFLLILTFLFNDFKREQNELQLQAYYTEVKSDLQRSVVSEHNGYIIVTPGLSPRIYNFSILNQKYTVQEVISKFQNWPGIGEFKTEETIQGTTYHFRVERQPDQTLVIVFTGNTYAENMGASFNLFVRLSFLSIIVLGNIIILLWSRLTVDRINRLKGEVDSLSKNSYQMPIEIEGEDEITDLSKSIESMRQAIYKNEKTKQEMLQNISHDFKTPIAVMQSYAEAILDGVSDPKEAAVIIKQAEILNTKVKQLLELNKLEYLKNQNEFETVSIKELISNIVDNHKYRTDLEFIVNLDSSTYFGIKDNFYTAFNNIIDNAIRYAQSKIVITLKNKRLTFYNDGESIDEKFIEQLFSPYEKGQKGQFGLGMSIAQKTINHFNLVLKVENVEQGVMFIIEPL